MKPVLTQDGKPTLEHLEKGDIILVLMSDDLEKCVYFRDGYVSHRRYGTKEYLKLGEHREFLFVRESYWLQLKKFLGIKV